MRIAVIGAGAIGGLVAGYLKEKGEEVTLVGRGEAVRRIKEKGLAISGARGNSLVKIDISETLNYIPELAILTTKTQDIDPVLRDNSLVLRNCLFLTTQNGVQADSLAAKYIEPEKIISSIVMFGATYLEPGRVVHNFEGSWVLGSFSHPQPLEILNSLKETLGKAFPVVISEDIKGMKYLKIFTNANNCLPGILGKSMQEVFSDLDLSRISVAIWREGLRIIEKAGIKLTSLPGFPVENITKLTSMPAGDAAKIFSGIMQGLSKEPLYGSILQSIMRSRPSEIDYINGEFVRLAEKNNTAAPLNKILVEMVHSVEKNNRFYGKEDLVKKTKELV